MSQYDKLLKRLMSKPRDFEWSELTLLLRHLGFDLIRDTGSSARKFIHREKQHLIISLHEPHPKKIVLVCYLTQIIRRLKEGGLIE